MASSDIRIGGRIAFEIDDDQYSRALEVVASLRDDPADRQVSRELIDLVVELTDVGLAYFFLHPLELADVGAIRRQGVKVALGTAGRVLPAVVRSTVGSMNERQLLKIADFIEHIVGGAGEE